MKARCQGVIRVGRWPFGEGKLPGAKTASEAKTQEEDTTVREGAHSAILAKRQRSPRAALRD
jgi:hypothetical protein